MPCIIWYIHIFVKIKWIELKIEVYNEDNLSLISVMSQRNHSFNRIDHCTMRNRPVHAWCSTVLFKDMPDVLLYKLNLYCAYCNMPRNLWNSLCYVIIKVHVMYMHGILLYHSKLYCANCIESVWPFKEKAKVYHT